MAVLLLSLGIFISCQKESVENLQTDSALSSLQFDATSEINTSRNKKKNCCDITKYSIEVKEKTIETREESKDVISVSVVGYEDCKPGGLSVLIYNTKTQDPVSPDIKIDPTLTSFTMDKNLLECGKIYRYEIIVHIGGCREGLPFEGEFSFDCEPPTDCCDKDISVTPGSECGSFIICYDEYLDCNITNPQHQWIRNIHGSRLTRLNASCIQVSGYEDGDVIKFEVLFEIEGCEEYDGWHERTYTIDCEPEDCCNVEPNVKILQCNGKRIFVIKGYEECELTSHAVGGIKNLTDPSCNAEPVQDKCPFGQPCHIYTSFKCGHEYSYTFEQTVEGCKDKNILSGTFIYDCEMCNY